MKKIFLFSMMFLLVASIATAADQLTTPKQHYSRSTPIKTYREYYLDITDDTGVAGYAKSSPALFVGCIYEVETIPTAAANCTAANEPHDCCTAAATGATCAEPTDNYDITITDEHGANLTGTNLSNRDTADAEIAAITETCPLGRVTVNITTGSQNVDEASIRLIVKTKE